MRKQEIIINGESLTVLSSNLEGGGMYPADCYKEADENGFYAKDEAKLQAKADAKALEDAKDNTQEALDMLVADYPKFEV